MTQAPTSQQLDKTDPKQIGNLGAGDTPPHTPGTPIVWRGDGLKFITFKGRVYYVPDDGTFTVDPGFDWTVPCPYRPARAQSSI